MILDFEVAQDGALVEVSEGEACSADGDGGVLFAHQAYVFGDDDGPLVDVEAVADDDHVSVGGRVYGVLYLFPDLHDVVGGEQAGGRRKEGEEREDSTFGFHGVIGLREKGSIRPAWLRLPGL